MKFRLELRSSSEDCTVASADVARSNSAAEFQVVVFYSSSHCRRSIRIRLCHRGRYFGVSGSDRETRIQVAVSEDVAWRLWLALAGEEAGAPTGRPAGLT